eukprot:SAG11_NODE_6198_length_1367_cov_1.158517_1_plen_162_part_00
MGQLVVSRSTAVLRSTSVRIRIRTKFSTRVQLYSCNVCDTRSCVWHTLNLYRYLDTVVDLSTDFNGDSCTYLEVCTSISSKHRLHGHGHRQNGRDGDGVLNLVAPKVVIAWIWSWGRSTVSDGALQDGPGPKDQIPSTKKPALSVKTKFYMLLVRKYISRF